jgi:hypothetical protein
MGNPLQPAARPGEPVCCLRCGQEYKQDPPFEIECPVCHAPPGQYCRRPSGHSGPFVAFHAERDLEAARLGFYGHACTVVPTVQPRQLKLDREPVSAVAAAQLALF